MPVENPNDWPDTPQEFERKFGRAPSTDSELEWYFGNGEPSGEPPFGLSGERMSPLDAPASQGYYPASPAEARGGIGNPFPPEPGPSGRQAEKIKANQLFRSLNPEPSPSFQIPMTIPGEEAPTFRPELDNALPNVYSGLGRLLRGRKM